ncbi:TRAP transporter TatT component family protein [bacterium]|nr:TRAP transporter TatT component family protein [bacterium]
MRWIRFLMVATLAFALSGCGSLVTRWADNLQGAVLEHDDPAMVAGGLPAYLLMLDGVIKGDPENEDALYAAARLYTAYNSAFVIDENPERARVLAERAFDYAVRGASEDYDCFAAHHDGPFSAFEPCAGEFEDRDDIGALSVVIGAWAGYIQTHSGDWDAIADLAKIRLLAERMVAIDGDYEYGSPHLYMGVLHTIVPPALGGDFEAGRAEFEKALAAGRGKFVPAYVYYARQVALPLGDRELYVRLLNSALATPADVEPRLTLINTLARAQATRMLARLEDDMPVAIDEEAEPEEDVSLLQGESE